MALYLTQINLCRERERERQAGRCFSKYQVCVLYVPLVKCVECVGSVEISYEQTGKNSQHSWRLIGRVRQEKEREGERGKEREKQKLHQMYRVTCA